jgi:hypothetical protein
MSSVLSCTGYLENPFKKRATLMALQMPFLVISLPTRWQEDAPHGFSPLVLERISYVASTAGRAQLSLAADATLHHLSVDEVRRRSVKCQEAAW